MSAAPRVTLLAGGVGGAKMAEGLAASRYGEALTIIGNIADDHVFHGLWVSPDIDTLIYSLADIVDRDQGWGVAGDTFRTLDTLAALGAENTWMRLGDVDFATHIRRTQLQREGFGATEIIAEIAARRGVSVPILPPSDDPVCTRLRTDAGWLDFQEYFVRERCQPDVREIAFAGAPAATPTPQALTAIRDADVIVIAPSNPVVSIAPILAVPGIAHALQNACARTIAVSPLIGGRPVKGPADTLMRAAGLTADPAGLAAHYGDLIDMLVVDHADAAAADAIRGEGLDVAADAILMRDRDDKRRLAEAVVAHGLAVSS